MATNFQYKIAIFVGNNYLIIDSNHPEHLRFTYQKEKLAKQPIAQQNLPLGEVLLNAYRYKLSISLTPYLQISKIPTLIAVPSILTAGAAPVALVFVVPLIVTVGALYVVMVIIASLAKNL